MWKRIVPSLVALGAAFTTVAPVEAQPRHPSRPVRVAAPHAEILVHGAARPTHWIGSQRYVEGRLGERYVIRVHNPTWRRVEAVVSVDGRDAIDGRAASVHKRGYVIHPHGYVDIDGFRLSSQEVAAFRFTTVKDSYAARMGTSWRVGAIEVSLFPERAPVRHGRRERAADAAGESKRSKPRDADRPTAQGLGTQFGERRSSQVRETHFERQNWTQPAWRVSLRYDDQAGLCARGVRAMCPSPPRYDPGPVYAEPPPGWPDWRGHRR